MARSAGTCLKELYYTYSVYMRGKTPQQIRAGIIKGELRSVDLEKAVSIE